jgi:hypothetical protein
MIDWAAYGRTMGQHANFDKSSSHPRHRPPPLVIPATLPLALRRIDSSPMAKRRLGVWFIGAKGGVSTTTIVGLVIVLIHAVTAAFRFSFFFCAASAIYLLLRHDVDEKEMDEIYLGETAAQIAPASGAP